MTTVDADGTPAPATPALDRALSPLAVVGVAAGCFGLEQLLLALTWSPPDGWVALLVAPTAGVVLPLWGLCRALDLPLPAALRLHRPSARETAGAMLVAIGALAPVYAASRAMSAWLQPPPDLADFYAGFLPTSRAALVAGGLGIVVLAPLAEELLFRGLVLRALARVVAMPIAVVASAVAFGAVHGSLWLLVPVSVLGLVLAAVTSRTNGIACAWIVHAVFNAVAYVELCATHDVATDAVARFVTRAPIAVGLVAMFACGWWVLPRRRQEARSPQLDVAANEPASDPSDHL